MINNEYIGKNTLKNTKFIAKENNFKKILIFSGEKSFKISGAEDELKSIIKDFDYNIFYKTNKLPGIKDLRRFIFKINDFKPDLIVAVGGGTVLDLAKISNCLFNEQIHELDLKIKNNTYSVDKKHCEIIAIPTTAGSGAEATSNAVIYIENIKYSIEGENIKPNYIIIEPNLVLSTPKNIANAAGMDAIAQAIESLLSVKSNNMSVEFAEKSLRFSLENFVKHINSSSYETAYKMSMGALFGGKAINISKTTAPHALSYAFTSYFNIKHGHAVNLTLTDFLKYNYINQEKANVNFDLKERFKIIFNSFAVTSINDLESKIKNISNQVGLNLNFKDLNIKTKNDIDLIMSNINEQRLKKTIL